MQIDIRLCILVAVELCVWLTAGALSCLRGRRLLCVALLLLSLSPLTRIVLELVSNQSTGLCFPHSASVLYPPAWLDRTPGSRG